MTTYIPYSLRHNITDPDIAKLVDHLERVRWWDIEYSEAEWFPIIQYTAKRLAITIYEWLVTVDYNWDYATLPYDMFFGNMEWILAYVK